MAFPPPAGNAPFEQMFPISVMSAVCDGFLGAYSRFAPNGAQRNDSPLPGH